MTRGRLCPFACMQSIPSSAVADLKHSAYLISRSFATCSAKLLTTFLPWDPAFQLFIHCALQYIMFFFSSASNFMLACILQVAAVSHRAPPAIRRADVSVVTQMSSKQLADLAPYTQFARAAYCSPTIVTGWQCGRTQSHPTLFGLPRLNNRVLRGLRCGA